ncbi:MAG: hypothetical protein ACQGVK_10345 [Myxococcota bacterium]
MIHLHDDHTDDRTPRRSLLSQLLVRLRSAQRPPFEIALTFWQAELAKRLSPVRLRWLFLENLTLGHDCDRDEAATLCFQRIAPRFRQADAREVYELAAGEEGALRFTPLAASPDELFVTLTTGPGRGLAEVDRMDWGLCFDVEPAFHTFAEIGSLDEWRQATRDGPVAGRELSGVLVGAMDPARHPSRVTGPLR